MAAISLCRVGHQCFFEWLWLPFTLLYRLADDWLFLFWTLGQSDWSEIDQDFYSDDEELSIYFGDEAKIENCARTAKSQASNDAASLSDQPGTLMIRKSKLQHSETAVG